MTGNNPTPRPKPPSPPFDRRIPEGDRLAAAAERIRRRQIAVTITCVLHAAEVGEWCGRIGGSGAWWACEGRFQAAVRRQIRRRQAAERAEQEQAGQVEQISPSTTAATTEEENR